MVERVERSRKVGWRPRAGAYRDSVLRGVGVVPSVGCPPGRQVERQVAVMVREGRLGPGRRLPSTRRLAARVGVHRNTVAAAYRRLADRGLIELRHGARARVAGGRLRPRESVDAPPDRGSFVRVAAEDPGSARLMAAELPGSLRTGAADVPAETSVPGGSGAGRTPGGRPVVLALPGASAGGSVAGDDVARIRARQDRRAALARRLRELPRLGVVALLSGSRALREAVRSDAARLRGDALTVRAADPRDPEEVREARGGADLVIADRLATDASYAPPSAARPRRGRAVRLLSPETLVEAVRVLDGAADGTSRLCFDEERP